MNEEKKNINYGKLKNLPLFPLKRFIMNWSDTYFKPIFLLPVFLSWTSLGWIDPLADKIREGNQRYQDGKYNEALDKYVNAQLESPNTPHIDFNIADTQYKRGKYDEAVQSYEKVMKSGNAEMRAKSSFNMGNTLYRQGKTTEAQESYKKTIDIIDELESKGNRDLDTLKNNALYNYEYIEKKKEEEQKQQQQNKQQKDQQEKEDKDTRKNEEQPDKDKDKKKDKEESPQNQQQTKPEDNPEKNEEKKEKSPRHSEKDKQKEQPQEQKLQQPSGQKQMTKEEAERLLDTLNQSEKEARAIQREKQQTQHGSVEKDW
ncbi:MAG TPA: tetratricopeptide repeat protein [Candidatus Brocadiaceae bacterium]